MIADIVSRLTEEDAEVIQLMGDGVDPHLYKPTRDDMIRLTNADIVFYNGLMLEGKMQELLARDSSSQKFIAVTKDIPQQNLLGGEIHADPHVWMDVRLWKIALSTMTEELCRKLPQHTDKIRDRFKKLEIEFDALHSYGLKAIESIPIDESGAEMTFTAIKRTAEAARIYRTSSPKRNVMIVVFTDEVGNDQDKADDTTKLCAMLGIPVYVVGVPAPFGLAEVRMKYVEFDPKYDQEEQWVVIEQGPETLYPEVVRVRSGRFADDAIDSGFGPFSLSKLCADTGGIYFRVHPNSGARGRVTDAMTAPLSSRLRHFFDPDVMRAYQPDYVSQAKLKEEIASNRAKAALVEAARKTVVEPMESPETVFPRKDEGSLKALLGEAQKAAARLQPKLDVLYELLKSGLPDREKLREKRWQAGYDLALGRVLAVKVRTDAYNLMLAQASLGMNFKNPKSDTWKLEPSDQVKVGSATEKLATQATELLTRVVNDHEGTPWALLAAEELRTPLGYEWTETFTDTNGVKPMAGNNANVPNARADDKKKMLGPPKPKRDPKRL